MAQGSVKSDSQGVNGIEEPLLKHVDCSSNCDTKARGSDTVTPYANAGLFRTLTFSWITPLLALGVEKTTLDLDDIPQLDAINRVFTAFAVFREKLLKLSSSDEDRVVSTTAVALAKALFLSAWKEIVWTALLAILYTLTRYVPPYLIDSFVECLSEPGKLRGQGYILTLTIASASVLEVLIRRHWIFRMQQVGIRLRGATTVMIYNKSLRLPSQSSKLHDQASGSGGELINAVSVDVETLNSFIWYMHDSWVIILQVGLALMILYKNLGLLATVAALVVTVSFMLLNMIFLRCQERFQGKLMKSKDSRMKSTMETLRHMRVLKLQGWEISFLSKILQLRKVEMQWLKKYLYSSALMSFFFNVAPIFVAVVAFGTCIYLRIPLEAGMVLSSLATFRVLQEPIYNLPDTISMLIQTKVSLGRIASFLSLDERQDNVLERLPLGSSDTAIEIVAGSFAWENTSSPATATLKDINFKVSHGMKVAVCGVVGSGKSSLLSCILGEIPKISGAVKLCGSKAYVAQSPWIQSGTVQENILFGKELDAERYDKVLESCCLKKDLEILSFGDKTVIGERGINLSGGQKQRIQIARALYSDADIYLFDDPFSAVDAHTGSHLFKEVLLGLLKGKTVVYVTHQVQFLHAADLIVVMNDGSISQAGSYDDILVPGSHFMNLVGAQNAALTPLDSNMAHSLSEEDGNLRQQAKNCDRRLSITNNGNVQQEDETHAKQNGAVDDVGVSGLKPAAQLIKEEEREKGSVGFAVYWKYITTAYGGILVLLALLCQILYQILKMGSNFWLVEVTSSSMSSKDAKPTVNGSTVIIVYATLSLGVTLCTFAVNLLVATIGYLTATILFRKMLQSIFRAPMSFFDATPSGRILNRCSTDLSAVETRILNVLEGVAFEVISLLGIIALMGFVSWQVMTVFIPMILAAVWYQRYYLPSSRELSRLGGVSQAPVIQHFAETLSGITTIRSFDQESIFESKYMKVVDAYARPEFHSAAAMKWLMLRLETCSCLTFTFLLVISVFYSERIDPAIAGLAVTYGLSLNNALAGMMWCLSHCETKMISVERILQYASIPSEGPLTIEANRPDCSWPSQGKIVIDNLQVQYAPQLPLVLRGLTCTLKGGMKTGIVGRTGSGKSTLIQALFRTVEPTTGQILIDGVNISSIGLHDLRSRLSIIPQDPTMFQGTIRSNLDPLEQYADEQVWETLDRCQLGDEVRKMEKMLDSNVVENGENWSMGQRQLICLGRVLLKKSKVLVLDEATASVDTATDNLIQQTLKLHFSHCTVITVAHRITSVLDSDMVLLLSDGLVEECDSPQRLLQDKSSAFAQLVEEYKASFSNSNYHSSKTKSTDDQ